MSMTAGVGQGKGECGQGARRVGARTGDNGQVSPVHYRLAPALTVRFVGAYLLLLAVVMVLTTVVVAVLSGPVDVLVVVLLVGLAVLGAGAWWLTSRAYVVRLDDEGYDVRLVRGAGVRAAAWSDVREVVAGFPRDIPCLVLHLADGRTTTIPVQAVRSDRDELAGDVRDRLRRAIRRA